jgi:hypothetical protein
MFLTPKPPSSFGKQMFSQAILAPPEASSQPFPNKDLSNEVIFKTTSLERLNKDDRYT